MSIKTNAKKIQGTMSLDSNNKLTVTLDDLTEVEVNKDLVEDFIAKLNNITNYSNSISSHEKNMLISLKNDIINAVGENDSVVDNEFNELKNNLQQDLDTIKSNFENTYIPALDTLDDNHMANILSLLNDRYSVNGQVETFMNGVLNDNYTILDKFKPTLDETGVFTSHAKSTMDQNKTEITALISDISNNLTARLTAMTADKGVLEDDIIDKIKTMLETIHDDLEDMLFNAVSMKRDSDAVIGINKIKTDLYNKINLKIFSTMIEYDISEITSSMLNDQGSGSDTDVQDAKALKLKQEIMNYLSGVSDISDVSYLFEENSIDDNFSSAVAEFSDRIIEEKITKLEEISNNSSDIDTVVSVNNERINGVKDDVFYQQGKLFKLTEEVNDGFVSGYSYSNKNSDRYIGSDLRLYSSYKSYSPGECCLTVPNEVWMSLDYNQGEVPGLYSSSFIVTEVDDTYAVSYSDTATTWTIVDSLGSTHTYDMNSTISRGKSVLTMRYNTPYSDEDNEDNRLLKVTYVGNSNIFIKDYFNKIGGVYRFNDVDDYWDCLGPIRLDGGSPFSPVTSGELMILPSLTDNSVNLYKYTPNDENEMLTAKELLRYVNVNKNYPVVVVIKNIQYSEYNKDSTYSAGTIVIQDGFLYRSKVNSNNHQPLIRTKRWRRLGKLTSDSISGAVKILNDDTGDHYYLTFKYGQETTLETLNNELIGGVE